MNKGPLSALLIVVILASAGVGYFSGVAGQRTVTSVSTTTLSTVYRSRVFTMRVNGTSYYADDVSNDTVVGNPGPSYFLNGSVTFDGVKFDLLCPPSYDMCPAEEGVSQSVVTFGIGSFTFNMTFQDGKTETAGNLIGDLDYSLALSQHTNPRAGMLVEYFSYQSPVTIFRVFLLVSV